MACLHIMKRYYNLEYVYVLQFDEYAEGVEKKKASFSHYNILPLNITSGPTQPVMEIPEVRLCSINFICIDFFYTTCSLNDYLVCVKTADKSSSGASSLDTESSNAKARSD